MHDDFNMVLITPKKPDNDLKVLIFLVGLKTRLGYILRNINANVLKSKFFEFSSKIDIIHVYYIELALIERLCIKKKKKKHLLKMTVL